jgi:hypothetical protein
VGHLGVPSAMVPQYNHLATVFQQHLPWSKVTRQHPVLMFTGHVCFLLLLLQPGPVGGRPFQPAAGR